MESHLENTDLDVGHSELLHASVECIDDFLSKLIVLVTSLSIPNVNNNWEPFLEIFAGEDWHLFKEFLAGI